ncbi:MAG: alpha/beta fold hydrolase [Arenibacterium sp.]
MSALGVIFVVIFGLLLLITVVTAYLASEARAVVPKRGKVTKVRGGAIHWVESGQGRPIVMIHGLGGNLLNFTYALNEHLDDDFRVISIDRPGCGWSERTGEEQATLGEQARMISDFIEAEKLENPLIVGHSLGGAIAVAMGLNHPEGLGGLALICPATQPIENTPDVFKGFEISSAWVRWTIAHTIAGPMGLLMQNKVYSEIFKPEAVVRDFGPKAGATLGRTPEAFIAASEDISGAQSSVSAIAEREAELKVPTAVLYADEDNILDPKLHGEHFASLSGADLKTLPGRGHMIPMTAPRDCADFIREMAAKTA